MCHIVMLIIKILKKLKNAYEYYKRIAWRITSDDFKILKTARACGLVSWELISPGNISYSWHRERIKCHLRSNNVSSVNRITRRTLFNGFDWNWKDIVIPSFSVLPVGPRPSMVTIFRLAVSDRGRPKKRAILAASLADQCFQVVHFAGAPKCGRSSKRSNGAL